MPPAVSQDLAVTVNGRPLSLEGVDPNTTLLAFLRSRGLTGTKEGCAEGECGACAVAHVRRRGDKGAAYEAINSCLVLVAALADSEVWTAEGLATQGELHPVQKALVETGGSQCGYCTPGFVVSLFAEYYRQDRDGYDPEAIAGNLCRCTGYRPIRDAASSMSLPMAGDAFADRLAKPAPRLPRRTIESSGGTLHRPDSLDEALKLLSDHPKAQVLAGGTDLVVNINQSGARHECIVSLEAVGELQTMEVDDARWTIGAAVPLSRLDEDLSAQIPLFAQLFPLFSSKLIRNRATLGGNVVNASPIGDGPPVLLALDAVLMLESAGAKRSMPIDEFFIDYRKTSLAPGELLTAIQIPRPLPESARFYKVSKRAQDDISTVAAAFALDLSEDGTIQKLRMAYGGVGPTPRRIKEAESTLTGRPWDQAAIDDAFGIIERTIHPISDHRGSAEYRLAMAKSLLQRFFFETSQEGPA